MKNFAAVLFLAAFCSGAAAQGEANYPSKPITIIVPWTTGGSPDLLARTIGEKLSQRLGQPVIVENRAGASGTIGAAHVAKAAADGYTLMSTPNTFALSPLVLPKAVMSFDVEKDFEPVILPAKTLMVLAVHRSLGVRTLADLVRYARSNPGLGFTGSSNGSPQHIAGEMLNKAAGIDMKFIPYKGTAPAIADVVGGHVPVLFAVYPNVAQHEKNGTLTILGGLDADRTSVAPNVVPLREQGFPNLVVGVWTGLFAPKGTPRGIVAKLNQEINAVLALPEVRQKLEQHGQILVGGGPEVLAGVVRKDLERYAPIVKSANITAD
jgi:tripartite-type tricarboxylate transporter receptor subunit TctC